MSSSPLLIASQCSGLPSGSIDSEFPPDNTLSLGERLSFTVEKDFLIIIGTYIFLQNGILLQCWTKYSDKNFNNSTPRSCCCGWASSLCPWTLQCVGYIFTFHLAIGQPKTLSIRLYDILWVNIGETVITLKFAKIISKFSAKPAALSYSFEEPARETVEKWASNLLVRAYEGQTHHPVRHLCSRWLVQIPSH